MGRFEFGFQGSVLATAPLRLFVRGRRSRSPLPVRVLEIESASDAMRTVDLFSIEIAFYGVAAAMLGSGAYVLLRMEETHPEFGTHASVTAPRPTESVPE